MSELDPDERRQYEEFIQSFEQFNSTWFGERCPDYEPECYCCKAWKLYDNYKELVGY